MGLVGIPLGLEALEDFVKTGRVAGIFARYLEQLDPQEQAEFRQALQTDIPLNSRTVSQFLDSPMGSDLLTYGGELVQTTDQTNGAEALRTALVEAADSGELTLLNTVAEFPSATVHLDGLKVLGVTRQIARLVRATNGVIGTISQIADADSANQPNFDFNTHANLQELGPWDWQRQILDFSDPDRPFRLGQSKSMPRPVVIDLYLPIDDTDDTTAPIPLVVISHGLGSNRQAFGPVAEHLASYGFGVAAIEHPGSNSTYQQALFQGDADEMFQAAEFFNRPQDVTFVLDQLQGLSESGQLDVVLDLDQVGVIGHSFGGYTALALAGATIDFNQLNQSCGVDTAYFNISLLLQCRALELDQREAMLDLRDRRVGAIMPVNPVASAVFGPQSLQQIEIPLLMGTGSQDPVAPALLEQIQVFTEVRSDDRYLAVAKGASHDSNLMALQRALLPSLSSLLATDPNLYQNYFKALAVAFLQRYIAQQPQYQPYLQAAHAKAISQSPHTLNLVDGDAVPQIARTMDQFTLP
jgi:predicted dienelactone hydrolase